MRRLSRMYVCLHHRGVGGVRAALSAGGGQGDGGGMEAGVTAVVAFGLRLFFFFP